MTELSREKIEELLAPRELQPDKDAALLLAFAKSKPKGFAWGEAAKKFGWERTYFYAIVRRVRMSLREDDMTLVCEPKGGVAPWTYRLVGTPDEAKWWGVNRVADAETRIGTMAATMGSVANATDARTTEGKKARIIHRGLNRISEDLAEVQGRLA